jgi:hypothetical protein
MSCDERAGIPKWPALSFIRSTTIGLDTPMIRDADFLQPQAGTYAAQVSVSGWPSV